MPHPLFALLLCAWLALFCHGASATPAQASTAPLHQLRLAALGSLGDFYLLYGVDADPAHSQALERRMGQAESQLAGLGDDGEVQRLRQQWHGYAGLLRELHAQLQRQEDVEGRAIAELIDLNNQLVRQTDNLARQLPATTTELVRRGRDLELLLQQLTTRYIAYNVGANTLGGDEQAIDQLARQFTRGLETLPAAPAAEYQRLLRQIHSTWRYIEPALRDYQSSAIPSLVSRYSTRLIADIAQLPSAGATPPSP